MTNPLANPTPELARRIADIEERMASLVADIADLTVTQLGKSPRHIGFGKRPALIVIDLANYWTKPDYPAYCPSSDAVIDNLQPLLAKAREKDIPIAFTSQAYRVAQGPKTDAGTMLGKLGQGNLDAGTQSTGLKKDTHATEIDDRLTILPDEQLVEKKAASAFSGTYLQTWLHTQGVDTVLLTGVVTSGCVRATAADALALGFRPIVVEECVDDIMPGATTWTLFDISTKIGDVVPVARVLEYLDALPTPEA